MSLVILFNNFSIQNVFKFQSVFKNGLKNALKMIILLEDDMEY